MISIDGPTCITKHSDVLPPIATAMRQPIKASCCPMASRAKVGASSVPADVQRAGRQKLPAHYECRYDGELLHNCWHKKAGGTRHGTHFRRIFTLPFSINPDKDGISIGLPMPRDGPKIFSTMVSVNAICEAVAG